MSATGVNPYNTPYSLPTGVTPVTYTNGIVVYMIFGRHTNEVFFRSFLECRSKIFSQQQDPALGCRPVALLSSSRVLILGKFDKHTHVTLPECAQRMLSHSKNLFLDLSVFSVSNSPDRITNRSPLWSHQAHLVPLMCHIEVTTSNYPGPTLLALLSYSYGLPQAVLYAKYSNLHVLTRFTHAGVGAGTATNSFPLVSCCAAPAVLPLLLTTLPSASAGLLLRALSTPLKCSSED